MAFLALLFLVRSIEASILVDVLKSTKWQYLILALLLVIPNMLIQLLKWHYLLKLANPETPFTSAFNSLLAGYPLGLVTPARLGEFGRAFFVKELHRIKTLKLVMIDKITNLFIIILFGLAGLLCLTQNTQVSNHKLILYPVFLILAVILFSPSLFSLIHKMIFRPFNETSTFGGQQYVMLIVFSILFYSIFLTQFICLVLSFENVNPFVAADGAASVFLVKTLLPISFGDLGIREGASVFFFDKIGLTAPQAFNASILLFLINVGIPSLLGLWILLKNGLKAK
ncbi:MAG: lysylphosphatidylglycerol synthase transmembrane domain-containing protein [bacterium]